VSLPAYPVGHNSLPAYPVGHNSLPAYPVGHNSLPAYPVGHNSQCSAKPCGGGDAVPQVNTMFRVASSSSTVGVECAFRV
jgi:hypothetical protein